MRTGIRALFISLKEIQYKIAIKPDNEMQEKTQYIFKGLYGVKELLVEMLL